MTVIYSFRWSQAGTDPGGVDTEAGKVPHCSHPLAGLMIKCTGVFHAAYWCFRRPDRWS
jgi:hypothetical protein